MGRLSPLSLLRDTMRDEADGEGGGGIAMALGMRARGVRDVRDLDGVPNPMPVAVAGTGRGVLNGEEKLRLGEEVPLLALDGRVVFTREGLPNAGGSLLAPEPVSRAVSCLAVMPTYLLAREPGVIFDSAAGLPATAPKFGLGIGAGRWL